MFARLFGVLLVIVLVLGSVAYAEPPHVVGSSDHVGDSPRRGRGDGSHMGISERVRAKVWQAFCEGNSTPCRVVQGEDIKRYVRRAIARRAEVRNTVPTDELRGGDVGEHLRINDVIRETAERFRQSRQEWWQIRQQYLAGELDENAYFEKTRDFLLVAIDVVTTRLESIKTAANTAVTTSEIDERISELEQLKSEVNSAKALEELRVVYPRLQEKMVEVQRNVVFRNYARMSFGLCKSIAARLDVAAARLAAVADRLRATSIYDEDLDARITAVFAMIDNLRDEFNAYRARVESKEVGVREFAQEMERIREQIRDVHREIRDLRAEVKKLRSMQGSVGPIRTRSTAEGTGASK